MIKSMESSSDEQGVPKERLINMDSKRAYIALLGLDQIPENAGDFPKEVFLPPEYLGSMEQAILETKEDGRERSQFIFVNAKTNQLKQSRIYRGTKENASGLATLLSLSRNFLSKDLMRYHTHPTPFHEDQSPSVNDFAISIANPKAEFIAMVATREGVHAIFQTARIARSSFSPIIPIIIKRLIDKGWRYAHKISQNPGDHSALAHIIESEGFVHYFWKVTSSDLKQGDMALGITMKKTVPKPFSGRVEK